MSENTNSKPSKQGATWVAKLSALMHARREKRHYHDQANPESREEMDAEWTTISKAFVESLGLSVVNDLTTTSFLANGGLDHEPLPHEAGDTPKKWLIFASSSADARLPDDIKAEMETHGVDGFIWISTVKRRATLRRRIQRLPMDMRCLPHALYALADVDRSVNLGSTAGKLYTEKFRTERSFEQILGVTTGIITTFAGWYLVIVLVVHIEWREGGYLIGIVKGWGLLMLTVMPMWIAVGTSAFLRRFGRPMILLLVIPVAIVWIAGSYNWIRDFLIGATLGVTFYLIGRPKRTPGLLNPIHGTKHSLTNQARILWISIWLVTTWLSVSITDRYLSSGWLPQSAITVYPERFGPLHDRYNKKWEPATPQIDVALSGGGYRAAIFHAGVLEALEELALRVDTMATISGGSIIGSFYAVGGKPRAFAIAVEEGRFNLKREVLNMWELARVACPGKLFEMDFWFFCDPYGRSDLQAGLMDRVLLEGRTMAELPDPSGTNGAPRLIIGAVDLRTGDELGFTRDSLLRISQAKPSDKVTRGTLPSVPSKIESQPMNSLADMRVAELVAGSGAFPGAINSVLIAGETESNADFEPFNIADGGLGDNFGLSLLLANTESHKNVIVVSDGSMPLGYVEGVSAFSEFTRGMDVVYASSGILNSMNIKEPPLVLRLSPLVLEELASDAAPESAYAEERLEHLFHTAPEDFLLQRNVHSINDLKRDIRRATKTFNEVSTLQDQFSTVPLDMVQQLWTTPDASVYHGAEQVWAIFALGKYLVYSACPQLVDALNLPDNEGCMITDSLPHASN